MKIRKHVYEDPTGGGDDITLEAPAWAEMPGTISVYDMEGDRYDFTMSEEGFNDEEEEEED